MKILILGANGFIGSNLTEAILKNKTWEIVGVDLVDRKISHLLKHPRFHFYQKDITVDHADIDTLIQNCDVMLPLVAIATPGVYITDPLRVFALDFEANLALIKQAFQYQKRIIFPSTSEVYGLCEDAEFNEETSNLVTGPIQKPRWIYSASKQLLDRVIYCYGQKGLEFTLFRPFNWIGPKLDNIDNPHAGGSRVLTQFVGNILRNEDIMLVNEGKQRRCFIDIDDGIDCLMHMIENQNQCASGRIFNVGNPKNNYSIRELAELLLKVLSTYPGYTDIIHKIRLVSVDGEIYYGKGYQDIARRVPSIANAKQYLQWEPHIPLEVTIQKTLDYYL